jgi:hypothetical protein
MIYYQVLHHPAWNCCQSREETCLERNHNLWFTLAWQIEFSLSPAARMLLSFIIIGSTVHKSSDARSEGSIGGRNALIIYPDAPWRWPWGRQ